MSSAALKVFPTWDEAGIRTSSQLPAIAAGSFQKKLEMPWYILG
jgi:hypothetical protein